MKKIFCVLLLLCVKHWVMAQHSLSVLVQDSTTHLTIPGVTVKVTGTNIGDITNTKGIATINNMPEGDQIISLSFIGYLSKTLHISFPNNDGTIKVELAPAEEIMNEVIVSSTRTNSRIEDLPMKVEVLGQEEMDEENQLKPGNVASILGDLSVIHVQQTSAVSGNTTIRMQGLDGRYTQLRRDGLPLFDGLSGNFGVLSIPPLDLKQIEIIKGSSSTLYGGGAIAGLINFISKAPSTERDLSFTLNHSSLNENNINGYYAQRFNKVGITLLAQQNLQQEADVNKDGLSDVPRTATTIFHPRLFYYFNPNSRLIAGYAFTYDNRIGGDMLAIDGKPDNVHSYLEKNRSIRNTFDFDYQNKPDTTHQLTIKGSVSNFNLNNNYDGANFKGNQLLDYLEANELIKAGKQDIVLGLNYNGEYFTKGLADYSALNNYTYHTLGAFIQDGFHLTHKLLIEGGLRSDYHNQYGWFVLPRLAFLYKPVSNLSLRLSSGLGYKTPNIFIPETLNEGYNNLLPVNSSLKSERSAGINFDMNYHIKLGEEASMDIDQALYYTHINNPISPVFNTDNTSSIDNIYNDITSTGTDTYIRFLIKSFELYFGFNHTISKETATNQVIYLPFSPQNKTSATVAYDVEGKWRFGLEGSYETGQYINQNQLVRNTFFLAAMVERKFGSHASLVLNCENLTDFRQSRYESLYTGSITHPVFKPLWGPIDGRIVNLALRVHL